MNVLIVSQCSKRAREETCRIVDLFAERAGHAVWQTVITQEGLATLRKLLRKTARRNSSIACHWIKKSGQSELLWIVGNPRRFNAHGRVPTHRTSRPVWIDADGHRWQCAESIALLAALAGLFHDFGKAGRSFQQSLTAKNAKRFQPFRHEWISVRLFQAFVGGRNDDEWLEALGNATAADETPLLERLLKDSATFSDSPFQSLPPVARAVAWLIVSHHRLPEDLKQKKKRSLNNPQNWLTGQLNADWNAQNHRDPSWTDKEWQNVWEFPKGTPLRSATWREKARQIVRRVNNAGSLAQWASMDQLFTLHMSRFCLMLADHFYSSGPAWVKWQDPKYLPWANSDRASGEPKQRVDEHLVGVAHHALLLGRQLKNVRSSLPSIGRHKALRSRSSSDYHWQNKAWDAALAMREQSREGGFFGVNMASTGCGKTFANARIMYTLTDDGEGCRMTVAMGLRTLTLQTGDAFRQRLHLDDDDLAVLVGSAAVRELWQEQEEKKQAEDDNNSASADRAFDEPDYVHYAGAIQSGVLDKWMGDDSKLRALVTAPVLVTTVDHIISATEGVRGGKQLAGILRLLSSDLILDEPDDFDISDLHAVCRLMNWAGMLGSRVLLSSATLPPALVQALFAAYRAGRMVWQASCGTPGKEIPVCCAWFDEYQPQTAQIASGLDFNEQHLQFVRKRAAALAKKERLHFGRLLALPPVEKNDVITMLASALHGEMLALHEAHRETHCSGKTVSLGLVRFANINPLVAVARALFAMPSPDDVCIHYCVYHARYPLVVRSSIEQCLDGAFNRHHPDALWQQPAIAQALQRRAEKHHLFVVLGSPVMEVGRDWDASWGIVEPSSMRSLIQFAGRVQRHRRQALDIENIVILDSNIKALRGENPAFIKPGFETSRHPFTSHNLRDLLPESDYQTITALPRILPSASENRLAAPEHLRLHEGLMKKFKQKELRHCVAADWWRESLTWSAYLQRMTPFRQSRPDQVFFLHLEDEDAEPYFAIRDEDGGIKVTDIIRQGSLSIANGVDVWGAADYKKILAELAQSQGREFSHIAPVFGEIRLDCDNEEEVRDWLYHRWLGVYRDY